MTPREAAASVEIATLRARILRQPHEPPCPHGWEPPAHDRECLCWIGRAADFLEAASGESQPVPSLERELRIEWWNNHGCPSFSRYGDDGEFQCGRCRSDFKRMPLDALRVRVNELRMIRVAEAMRRHIGPADAPKEQL